MDVSRFRPGDEVFGIGKGTFANYARAPQDKLAHKPANLTFEQAAVLAISGETALQALRNHGRVEPGQEVLVVGASGGVGTYAVQIAKAFGARVSGVCSSAWGWSDPSVRITSSTTHARTSPRAISATI